MSFLQQRIVQLQGELQRLQIVERRQHARGGFFVLCDLDGFKAAQDSHPDGHAYGDRVLRKFARFLMAVTRVSEDSISVRFGGDEFVVWVPDAPGASAVEARVRMWRIDGVTCTTGSGKTMELADARLMRNKNWRTSV